jgi:hypothetical protein
MVYHLPLLLGRKTAVGPNKVGWNIKAELLKTTETITSYAKIRWVGIRLPTKADRLRGPIQLGTGGLPPPPPSSGRVVVTRLVASRLKMVEPYIRSPMRLHGVVPNWLRPRITLSFIPLLNPLVCYALILIILLQHCLPVEQIIFDLPSFRIMSSRLRAWNLGRT